MKNNTTTPDVTLRTAARELVIESVIWAAFRQHESNYHKLHIHRDGSISWLTCFNQSDDVIDREAQGFAAVPSVITVGTGSCDCNCDYCTSDYDMRADAIADAVSNSDLSDMENAMLAALDEIPAGYFDDENGAQK
jgi:hypothetical protein